MTRLTLASFFLLATSLALPGCAADSAQDRPALQNVAVDQAALVDLSRQKWLWMADRQLDRLNPLFHPQARFVHMSRTMNRAEELEVIRTGNIHYKHAEIRDISAEVIGDVAVVYSRIRLTAVVGGNEVVNPFSVTETYLQQDDGGWQLAGMAFSRLVGD